MVEKVNVLCGKKKLKKKSKIKLKLKTQKNIVIVKMALCKLWICDVCLFICCLCVTLFDFNNRFSKILYSIDRSTSLSYTQSCINLNNVTLNKLVTFNNCHVIQRQTIPRGRKKLINSNLQLSTTKRNPTSFFLCNIYSYSLSLSISLWLPYAFNFVMLV